MAEETIWRGTSAQWKNFGVYILCALFCWLIVPIFIAPARYLQTKNKVYELTTERLKITAGVFRRDDARNAHVPYIANPARGGGSRGRVCPMDGHGN
jgi:membrane protein YdbS with pleckstrin-like domain